MGRQVDWNEVPDSSLLPQGIYEVAIESITETVSKEKSLLMYAVVFRVAGGAFDGTPIYEYCVVGNADDPNGDDPETWKTSLGVRRLKRMIKAAGAALSNDVDEAIQASLGQHLMLTIDQETDDGSKNPKYKGVIRNRIAAMYPMGEREATSSKTAPAAPKAAPAATGAGGVKTSTKVPLATCGQCKAQMPRTELLNHIKTAHAADDEE